MGHSKNRGRRRLTLPPHSRGAADSNGAVSQRLPTRVQRSRSMNTRRRRRDDGSTPAYLDNGGGTGCPGSRLISSFSSLPGLK